jgi:GxxExxY protein
MRVATAAELNGISEGVIGAAIEVHSHLGPGLLESSYEACLEYELLQRGFAVVRQLGLPVVYKGVSVECGYRIDLVVNDAVILELKAVDHLEPIHTAQLLTYLKLSNCRLGLIMNFNVKRMVDRVKRVVHEFPS